MESWLAMNQSYQRPRKVLFCCHGGPAYGLGHVMRCLALSQAATAQGWQTRFAGDIDPAWAGSHLEPGQVVAMTPAAQASQLAEIVDGWRPDVCHIDSYLPLPELGGKTLISNTRDGPFGRRPANLTIDPTLGAEMRQDWNDVDTTLLGRWYAPLRAQVLRQAQPAAPIGPDDAGGPWKILVVSGGTCPPALIAQVLDGLAAAARPTQATVVTATPAPSRSRGRSRIELVGLIDDLPAVARRHHVVISAAGTSVMDFAYLGVPMALVHAVDNQRAGYDAAVAAGLAIGLGSIAGLDARVTALVDDLNPATLAELAQTGRHLVDGRGAWRVVATWSQLLERQPTVRPPDVAIRPATLADAARLLAWRNDPVAREQSRQHRPIAWEDHLAWLTASLDRADRRVLVAEADGQPVGVVRWDAGDDGAWEASVTIDPARRGHRLGLAALAAAERALPSSRPLALEATIHRDNAASLAVFAQLGYLPFQPPDASGFARYRAWRQR